MWFVSVVCTTTLNGGESHKGNDDARDRYSAARRSRVPWRKSYGCAVRCVRSWRCRSSSSWMGVAHACELPQETLCIGHIPVRNNLFDLYLKEGTQFGGLATDFTRHDEIFAGSTRHQGSWISERLRRVLGGKRVMIRMQRGGLRRNGGGPRESRVVFGRLAKSEGVGPFDHSVESFDDAQMLKVTLGLKKVELLVASIHWRVGI